MRNAAIRVPGIDSRVRSYARGLGIGDERAISMAVGRYDDRLASGWNAAAAFEETCALLASWRRHLSNWRATGH
jgi:hypothetical protein